MSAALAPAPARPSAPSREMEFAFGAADHQAISRMVYEEAGILLPPAKAQLVYGRLVRRVRARGLDGFASYVALLDTDADERAKAVDALTTNHTSFFRESHHFDHFTEHYWPGLASRLSSGGRVRLWSAACSSGEEPYTLALALLGKDPGAAQKMARADFRILATDLSTEILATAKAARYSLETVKTVPGDLRNRWLSREGGEAAVRDEVRSLVTFRQLNLLRDWPMKGQFDAIFCRNVMIYFDDPTKARLQSRLADRLAPGGFLYIGHSERLADDVAPRFTCMGRTIYKKVTA